MLFKSVRRRWYAGRNIKTPMADFLSASWPKSNALFDELEFLVADIETTSLEANEGEIASIAWVVIEKGVIKLSLAESYLIQLERDVGQSAVFHHLHDECLSQALKVTPVFECFLKAAAGRVLVFHHAGLDMAFLNKLSRELYQTPLLAPIVDTLLLEKKKLLRHKEMVEPGELRLFNCRGRYSLPVYPAHDALCDAIATAELLLAYRACRGGEATLSGLL